MDCNAEEGIEEDEEGSRFKEGGGVVCPEKRAEEREVGRELTRLFCLSRLIGDLAIDFYTTIHTTMLLILEACVSIRAPTLDCLFSHVSAHGHILIVHSFRFIPLMSWTDR